MNEKEKKQSSQERGHNETAKPPKDLRLPAALVRTALSSEQTLMSWIRTSLSLFTFGFSITQFFYYLEQQKEGVQVSAGPRRLGIAIICIGLLGLVLAAVAHLQRLKKMKQRGLPTVSLISLPIVATTALLLIGIAVLIGITLS